VQPLRIIEIIIPAFYLSAHGYEKAMSRKGDFGIPLNNADCHDLRDGRSLVVADARQ
jgi:hypothetical protein